MNNVENFCGAKRKAQPDVRDFKFAALAASKKQTEEKLPEKVNLKPKFPPVYNQIYGNCTSNAALAIDAFYYHDPAGTWMPSTVFTYYNQRIMDKAGFLSDDGSTAETALKAIRKYGACNSKYWANDEPWNKKPSKAAYENGLKGHELTKFYATTTTLQIRKALAAGYPVICCMDWTFGFNFTLPDGYLLPDPTKKEIKDCDLGHSLAIVGYDDTRKVFELRNSWGPTWGNNGYAYISYSTAKKVIWWDDTYAVVK